MQNNDWFVYIGYVCGIPSDLSPLSIHSIAGSGVKADLCEGYDCSVQILAIFFPVRPFTAIGSHLEHLCNHSCKPKCTSISEHTVCTSWFLPILSHKQCSISWINSIKANFSRVEVMHFHLATLWQFLSQNIKNKSLFYFKNGQKDNGFYINA